MVTTPKIRPPSGRLITPFRQGVTPHIMAPSTGGSPDTFILPRRQVLWPQLATSSVGTWGWAANASQVFGGYRFNSSNAVGDKLFFANTRIPTDGKIIALGTKGSTRGVVDVYYNDALVTTLNFGTFGDQTNHIGSSSWSGFSGGIGTVEFRLRAGVGGLNYWPFQQIEIIDLATGTQYGTSIDDLPWFGDIPPICYSATNFTPQLSQVDIAQWGGRLYINGVGSYLEYDVWLPKGSVNLNVTHYAHPTLTTKVDVLLNGASSGSIETHRSSSGYNFLSTLALSVPYTGVHKVRFTCTNAGISGGVAFYLQWLSWRKTAETGAITPTGTTYGVGTRELWPWFQDSGDWDTFQISSSSLHYAKFYNSSNTQNDSQTWAHSLLPGTYGLLTVGRRINNYAIAHWSENGGPDLDTVDHYVSPGTQENHRMTGSLSLVGGDLSRTVASRNPSALDWYLNDTMIRLVRTGD